MKVVVIIYTNQSVLYTDVSWARWVGYASSVTRRGAADATKACPNPIKRLRIKVCSISIILWAPEVRTEHRWTCWPSSTPFVVQSPRTWWWHQETWRRVSRIHQRRKAWTDKTIRFRCPVKSYDFPHPAHDVNTYLTCIQYAKLIGWTYWAFPIAASVS